MPTPLAIVIINYRTPKLTIDCLRSLSRDIASLDGARVIVVDNGSADNSPSLLEQQIAQEGWASWASLVLASTNRGFSAGNNIGMRTCKADAYLLLNSDTLVRKGAVKRMLHALDDRPDIGIVGARLEWPDGEPQQSCFNFRTPITELLSAARTGVVTSLFPRHVGTLPVNHHPFEPDWVSFACVMIRTSVIDEIGMMDEGYFMYYDDIDYCRRARRAGWKTLYWPEARVVHLRGGSGPVKTLTQARKRRPEYLYASRARYYAKAYGRIGLWTANMLWEIGRAVSWTRELLGNKSPHTSAREPLDIWTNGVRPLQLPKVCQGQHA